MKHNINIGNDVLKNTVKNQFTRNKENEQGRLKENISREERYNGRTGKKSTHGG